MAYLLSQYLIFIAMALALGLFVGWATKGGLPDAPRGGVLRWAAAWFVVGLVVAAFGWLPGLVGHALEVALLLSAAYVIGAALGCAFGRAAGGSTGGGDLAAQPPPVAAAAAGWTHDDVLGVDSSASYPGVRPAVAPAGAVADDLTTIAGVDGLTGRQLAGIGVTQRAQIAQWGPPQVAWVEHHLAQPGRIGREKWIEQARAPAGSQPARAGQGAPAEPTDAATAPAPAPLRAGMTDGQRSLLAAREKLALQRARQAQAPQAASADARDDQSPTPAGDASAGPAAAPPPARRAPTVAPRAGMTDGQRSILAARQKQAARAAKTQAGVEDPARSTPEDKGFSGAREETPPRRKPDLI